MKNKLIYLVIGTLLLMSLVVGCSSKSLKSTSDYQADENTYAPSISSEPENISSAPTEEAYSTPTEEAIPTEPVLSDFELDIEAKPFLKGITNGDVVGETDFYSMHDIADTVTQDDKESPYLTDADSLTFKAKDATKNQKPKVKDYGSYTIYTTNQGLFFCQKGEDIKKSFGFLQSGFTYDNILVNDAGTVFIVMRNRLYILDTDQQLTYLNLGYGYYFSENMHYMAWSWIKSEDGPDTRHYLLLNIETENLTNFIFSNDACNADKYDILNFVIGNDGEIAISTAVFTGVATDWEGYDTAIFVSAEGLHNLYISNFTGEALYINKDYLVYTTQYKLMKADETGSNVLFEYVNFENETYHIEQHTEMVSYGIEEYMMNPYIVFRQYDIWSQRSTWATYDCKKLDFVNIDWSNK